MNSSGSPAPTHQVQRPPARIRRRKSPRQLLRDSLWSTEYLSLTMLALYTLLDLIFIQDVPSSFGILQINILVGIATIACAMWYQQTRTKVAYAFRSFYMLPVGYMMYAQVHSYIPLVNPHNYDPILASWDRALFGVDPTIWIYQFAHPIITEYFQIWYNFFQLMLVVPALGFFLSRQTRKFRTYAMMLLLGFYVSYLLYFIMPAIGPRFEVHDFLSIDTELPGLLLTEPFRDLINAGNNITNEMVDPYQVVNRDCMPSGHTMMSVLGILFAWRLGSRWRWFVTVGGISVVISTVYLRYHYVVDLIAGTILAITLFFLVDWIVRLWTRAGIRV